MRAARFLFISLLVLRCASVDRGPGDAVRRYLASKTLEQALSAFAPDYRLWFGERVGEGLDRAKVAKMLEWDYALNPGHRIDSFEVNGTEVTVRVHEDNDFSRLIGFPGWDATSTFVVDADGRIVSQVYVPVADQPEWRPYLDAPLAWIREHDPEVLPRIFNTGKLVQTRESAAEWVRVLRAWRAADHDVAVRAPGREF
ncbi:MAG: hypothetical protein ACJ74H_18010 [Thermoanaerobaculia bacterium]